MNLHEVEITATVSINGSNQPSSIFLRVPSGWAYSGWIYTHILYANTNGGMTFSPSYWSTCFLPQPYNEEHTP